MKIQLTAFIFGIALLMQPLSARSNPTPEPMQWGTVSFAGEYKIDVEIANTEALRTVGLMNRNQLAEDQGMLFVYPDPAIHAVWMKNTLIPLDVLFLSEDGKVVSLLRDLTPCKQDPCPISTSSAEALYMLEVNAGFIDKHRIQTGQDVTIDYKHTANQ